MNKKLKGLIDTIELIRKIAVDLFIFAAVITITIIIIKDEQNKQLIIYPFKVPQALIKRGYTGEVLTTKLLTRIDTIKSSGTVYYTSNNVDIPSWENKIDEFKNALSGDEYSAFFSIFKSLANNKAQNANGEFITPTRDSDDLQMSFRINGESDFIKAKGKSSDIDSLINIAAEYLLEKSDPYYLTVWYINNGEKEKCLKLIQQMLNDDDPKNDGLAWHLRGVFFLKQVDGRNRTTDNNNLTEAKKSFKLALAQIKSPWLTESNLGIVYYDEGRYDLARCMYKKSIVANSHTYFAYASYGNLLYKEYADPKKHDLKKLDSAIDYFHKAIEYNKSEIKLYISLFPALYARGKVSEANNIFQKATEMDPNNFMVYFQMGLVQLIYTKDQARAITYLKKADSLRKYNQSVPITDIQEKVLKMAVTNKN